MVYDIWYNQKLIGIARWIAGVIGAMIFVGALLVFAFPASVRGEFSTRETDIRIADIGSVVPVSIELRSELLPTCRQQTPLDIVLVVDRSGSMSGNAFASAIRGVETFAGIIDFSQHQVAVIFFSDQPYLIQPFTFEREQIRVAVAGQFANGATRISAALEEARAVSGGALARPDAEQVLVLMTDAQAGDLSDEEATLQIAQEMRDAGVEIYTIGLGDVYQPVLTGVASSLENVSIARTESELEAVFAQVAREVSLNAGTGLRLFEEVSERNFQILPTSIQPPASILNGVIQWEGLTLPRDSFSLNYSVVPMRYGWFDLSASLGPISIVDCTGATQIFEGFTGPKILVAPVWLMYLLPFWLLLALFAFWRRIYPIDFYPPEQMPSYEKPVFEVNWPKGVDGYKEELPDQFGYPTLIVALGKTGSFAAQLLRKGLLDRGEGQYPNGIRLLWLGRDDEHAPTPFNGVPLSPDEQRPMDPKFPHVHQAIEREPKKFEHLDWWLPSFDEKTRAAGRMSLFWEFEFDRDHRILKDIQGAAARLSDQTRGEHKVQLLFIGSLSEDICAALPDIAHLVRNQPGDKIGAILGLLLLPGIDTQNNEMEELAERRAAAFRELSRFVSGKEQLIRHMDSNQHLSYNFLFDSIFLYDDQDDAAKGLRGHPEQVLDAMVDQLLNLLEPSVANVFWKNHTASASHNLTSNEGDRNTLVGMKKNLTYWWPVEDIRRVCEARLVHDVLLRQESGLMIDPEDAKGAAIDFLRGTREQSGSLSGTDFEFGLLADVVEDTWPIIEPPEPLKQPPVNLLDGFRWEILRYLNKMADLNAEGGTSPLYGQLAYASAFLDALTQVLEEAAEELPYYENEPGSGHVAKTLRIEMPDLRAIVQTAQGQVKSWQNDLFQTNPLHKSNADSLFGAKTTALGGREGTTLASVVRARYLQIRDQFRALFEGYKPYVFKRLVMLPPDDDPADLTSSYYQESMVKSVENQRSALDEMQRRFGWYWDQDQNGNIRLRFSFLGSDVTQSSHAWKQYAYTFEYFDEALIKEIYRYARILSRKIRTRGSIDSILKNVHQVSQDSDLRNVPDAVGYGKGTGQSLVLRQYLSGPDAQRLTTWKNELNDERIEIIPVTEDPSRVSYSEVHLNLNAKQINTLQLDFEQRYKLDPALHAFLAEQYAVQIERKMKRLTTQLFSPRFVRLMAVPELFELALRCYMFGWLREARNDYDENKWFIIYPDGENLKRIPLFAKDVVEPKNIEDALQDCILTIPYQSRDDAHPLHNRNVSKTISLLEQAMADFRSKPREFKKTLEDRKEQLANKVSEARDSFQHDLAEYALWLLAQELKNK